MILQQEFLTPKESAQQSINLNLQEDSNQPKKSLSQKQIFYQQSTEKKKLFQKKEEIKKVQMQNEIQGMNKSHNNLPQIYYINEDDKYINYIKSLLGEDYQHLLKYNRTQKLVQEKFMPLKSQQNKLAQINPYEFARENTKAFQSLSQQKNFKQFVSGGFMPYGGKKFKEHKQFLQQVLQKNDQNYYSQKPSRKKQRQKVDQQQNEEPDFKIKQDNNCFVYEIKDIPHNKENYLLFAQSTENLIRDRKKYQPSSARKKENTEFEEISNIQNKNCLEYLRRFTKKKLDPD